MPNINVHDLDAAAHAAAAAAAVDMNAKGEEEWAPQFSAAGDFYIAARKAMTVDQGVAKIGTGTLAYSKSTKAAPGTFNACTLPADIEAGAWLKVTASAITGFVATHLKRTK